MLKKQIIRFIAVGIVNTLVYYFLYSLFIYLEFDYKLAVLFSSLIGMLFSFITFGRYVFSNNNKKLIGKFFLVYAILYVCNIGIISLVEVIIHNYYISGFLATICCAILSFILNKWYVYK
ncbi:GtrA family protein [Sulfurimonas sp.]|uniref:GtrA family protein n=1 Tax=Sulfurimonas sp. TaxID=2022749 RepID=UPI003564AE31